MTTSGDNPTVALGGVSYDVPPIAFREVSKILPLVNKVFVAMNMNDMSEAVLEGLGKIIFYGVTRGAKELTFEEFIDRPATVSEMMTAVMVVCKQAGIETKEAKPGEATGERIPQTSKN